MNAQGGNLCLAASSSRPTSSFLPLRLVNSVADVERLVPCRSARRQTSTRSATGQRKMGLASICSTWLASRGILRHLCPSAFQPGSGDRGSYRAWKPSYQAGMSRESRYLRCVLRRKTATRGTDGEGELASIKKARRSLVDLRS